MFLSKIRRSPDAFDDAGGITEMYNESMGIEPVVEVVEEAQDSQPLSIESAEPPVETLDVEPTPEPVTEEVAGLDSVVETVVEQPVVDSLEEVNARLQAQLNEMAARMQSIQAPPAVIPPTEADTLRTQQQADRAAVNPPAQPDVLELVNEGEFEAAFQSPAGFNAILNKVYQRATSDVMQRFAVMVPSMVNQQVTLQTMVQDFYRANDDLVPFSPFVGYVTNELASAHPEWEYKQLFKEVETEARKRLNKMKDQKRTVAPPVTAPKPGSRMPAPKPLSDLEKQLADMMDDML